VAGKRNQGCEIDGIILLDKPQGVTSNQALQRVKRLINAAKAGHTGSLDPLATGLLPLCFGEATKISAYLLEADKHYRAECRLGVRTDSGDATGAVIEEKPVKRYDHDHLEQILSRFRGEIEQTPPMYSALHHQGKRLYELARQGLTVARAPRRVSISRLELMASTADTLTLEVSCSKGTYIRSLVEDIGQVLGCGAHVLKLRRFGVDPFVSPRMVTMEMLAESVAKGKLEEWLIPMDRALEHWPQVHLLADQTRRILHGQAVALSVNEPRASPDRLRLYGADGSFLGIGERREGELRPLRLLRQVSQ
jgi:tRNA pseudouridine55 synthase